MRSRISALVSTLALSVALTGAAMAQATVNGMDPAAIEAAQAQAAANAARPGDDALTCDQLQAEMVATMQDPAMQANIAGLGQWAENQQGRADAARAAMAATVVPNVVVGVVSSFVPGAGYAQMAIQQAQMARMQAQAAESAQANAAMQPHLTGMMPGVYRGQRIYELAQAKQCPFLEQQGAPQ